MKKYIIIICIAIVLTIISIVGYFMYKNMNWQTDGDTLKAKADQEMQYLDTNIISLMNNFNHISYSNYKVVQSAAKISTQAQGGGSSQSSQQKSSGSQSGGGSQGNSNSGAQTEAEGGGGDSATEISNLLPSSILTNKDSKVDWDKMKQDVELIYNKWPSILVDLSSLNVNKNDLLKFTDTLNQVTTALEKKDKKIALAKLSDLYTLMNIYVKEYSDNQTMKNLSATKAYIVRAYALTEEDNKWSEMKKDISTAKTEYTKILNDSLNTNNVNSINKGYILLNEMEKNIDSKDKNIFFINYKNLMQELETIGK